MDFFKDFFKNAGSKGLPAAGGGAAGMYLSNKIINPMVVNYRKTTPLTDPAKPELPEMIAPLVPGFVGLFMLNKKDDWVSYAGAGMIGASVGTAAVQNFEFMHGDDSNRLADSLDEIFKKYMKK